MPNWCYNRLTISGDHETLRKFVEKAFGTPAYYPSEPNEPQPEGKYLCFNATVPTPQEVLITGYHNPSVRLGAQFTELMTGTYKGPLDGYYWNVQNWGTKWDIYNHKITPESMGWSDTCTQLEAHFDTAWGPAKTWVTKISDLFPDLKFHLFYSEPGCYFAGELTAEGGCATEHEYTERECARIFQDLF